MSEISSEILMQLEEAQATVSQTMVAGGPQVVAEAMTHSIGERIFVAARSVAAKDVRLDHSTTSRSRLLWALTVSS